MRYEQSYNSITGEQHKSNKTNDRSIYQSNPYTKTNPAPDYLMEEESEIKGMSEFFERQFVRYLPHKFVF